jgi:hypothetical protein
MSKQKRPEIGTVMWDVHENLYYDKIVDVAPLIEYVVTSAPITGYYEGGFVEICMVGPVPDGDRSFPYPRRHRLSDLGNKIVFTTAREAAIYAQELTEKYERTWAWCLKQPLRRTWEKYLEESP